MRYEDGIPELKPVANFKESERAAVVERIVSENSRRRTRAVVCIETGDTFHSANDAAIAVKRSRQAIVCAISNDRSCGGFHWKYAPRTDGEPVRVGRPPQPLLIGGKLYASISDAARQLNTPRWCIYNSMNRGYMNVRVEVKYVDPSNFQIEAGSAA